MKVAKIRAVKTPNRGTELSAGIDFFMPSFEDKFLNDLIKKNDHHIDIDFKVDKISIKPQHRILIPSGIKVKVPRGFALIAFNKSGISSKKGLSVMASVVDEDYQGEVHLSLLNTTNKIVAIGQDEKLVQFILVPMFYDGIELTAETHLFNSISERSDGGFGSTDKK